VWIYGGRSASLDVPVLLLGNPANARPAVMLHLGEIFEAVEVHGNISSFLTGSLLADGLCLVDIVNASNLEVVWAVGSEGECEESEQKHEDFHHW